MDPEEDGQRFCARVVQQIIELDDKWNEFVKYLVKVDGDKAN